MRHQVSGHQLSVVTASEHRLLPGAPGGLSDENPLPGPCKVLTGFISSQLMTEGPGFLLAALGSRGCPWSPEAVHSLAVCFMMPKELHQAVK